MAYTTVRNAVQLGRIGELIAEAVFEEAGYKCCRVNHEGFDLIVFDDDGESFRVEVKSASTGEGVNNIRYKFMTSKGSKSKRIVDLSDADLICLVALPLRRCVIRCVTTLEHKRTSLRAEDFDESEAAQIRKALTKVRKRK
jgi:predicted RecB family endonuclease